MHKQVLLVWTGRNKFCSERHQDSSNLKKEFQSLKTIHTIYGIIAVHSEAT